VLDETVRPEKRCDFTGKMTTDRFDSSDEILRS